MIWGGTAIVEGWWLNAEEAESHSVSAWRKMIWESAESNLGELNQKKVFCSAFSVCGCKKISLYAYEVK